MLAAVGGTAKLIGIAYLVVTVLGTLLAAALWRSTRSRRSVDPETLAERERTWLFIVLGALLALLFGTIFLVPYGRGSSRHAQVVNVTARQFAWTFDPPSVRAGKPVEFRLRSLDVNHGFAVYSPKHTFLFQVQVVPGSTQKLVHTFARPGTYEVLCFEFCGLGHHLMQGSFTVKAR